MKNQHLMNEVEKKHNEATGTNLAWDWKAKASKALDEGLKAGDRIHFGGHKKNIAELVDETHATMPNGQTIELNATMQERLLVCKAYTASKFAYLK